MAIAYEVEVLDGRANVVVQSELIANEAIPHDAADPRAAALTQSALVSEEHLGRGAAALLMHRTRLSGLRIATAMEHAIEGTPSLRVVTETWPDEARVVAIDTLEPGQRLRIVKFVAYGWSSTRTPRGG